jgi:hypothetical protein
MTAKGKIAIGNLIGRAISPNGSALSRTTDVVIDVMNLPDETR